MILTIHIQPDNFEADAILMQSLFPLDYENERYASAVATDESHGVISFILGGSQLTEEQVNWLDHMMDQHEILHWEVQQ